MTRDTAIDIAKLYIGQQLNQTPDTCKIIRCPAGNAQSKILEFVTKEGDTVEVRIRPRTSTIISQTVDADSHATFHSGKFEKVPLEEVFR